MLRVTAMEKLLIDKQIVSKEDLSKCAEEIANKISQVLLDKVKAAKDTADLISVLEIKRTKTNVVHYKARRN